MQRWFQNDIGRFDDTEHLSLLVGIIHANQFLIEGDGQWSIPTQFGHISPLTGFDGLFDAMHGIL